MKAFIATVVVILVLGVGGYLVFHKKNNTNANTTSSTTSANTTITPPTSTKSGTDKTAKPAATITYDGTTFSPASVTVKSGDTVAIKNTSTADLQMDSDPHPVHTDDPDLNVGMVSAGQTATFTVTKTGSFGYHNHLDSTQKGSITIQ